MAGANLESMASGRFKRKASINEDDVSHILQRYNATTVLMLLQEVSQAVSIASRIDWKNLVRRTGTGITSPREYQMLWRHLAYREDLSDRIDDGSEPLDIDSDLEFELEANPKPSEEILSESSLCVKLLLSASNTDIPTPHNNISTNEIATRGGTEKHQTVRIHRMTSNNSFPSVDQKSTQPIPLGSAVEGSDAANPVAPPKKKRKQWTKEEDSELIAAVGKIGENWAKIEAELKSERTPHQLLLRWNLIKKKQAVSQKPEVKAAAASWEERKAAQETFSLAIGNFSSIRPGGNPSANIPPVQANQGLIQPTPMPDAKPSPKPLHPANPIQPHHTMTKTLKTTLAPKTQNPKPNGPGPTAGPTPRPNGPSPAGPIPVRPNGSSPAGPIPIRPTGPSPAGTIPVPIPVRPTGPGPAGPGPAGPVRPTGPSPAGPIRPNGPSPAGPVRPNGPSPAVPAQSSGPSPSVIRPNGPGPSPPVRPNGPPAVPARPNGPSPPVSVRPNGPTPAGPTPRSNGPSPPVSTPRPNGPGPASRSSGPSPAGPTPRSNPSTQTPRSNGPGPSSLIQAAAFAAGGRIANPSTAASLLKAAQSKNVVHIRSGGVSVSKPILTAHTTIGARGPGLNGNLGASFGIGAVVEVDKHGFIEAKRDLGVGKGSKGEVASGIGNKEEGKVGL